MANKRVYNKIRTDELEVLAIQYGSHKMEEAMKAIVDLAKSIGAPIDIDYIGREIKIRIDYQNSWR